MDTRRLQSFVKIVELGTLRGAAEHLNVSQPSLTQLVKDLEAHFNVGLLIRTKRGVRPTAAGEILYVHAQSMIRQLQQATAELTIAGSEIRGPVSIGMPGTIAPVIALPLLRRVRAAYPQIRLQVVEGSNAQMAELTLNGRIDLALSSSEPVRGVNAELFLRDELVLVSAPSLNTALGEGPLSLAQLRDHPLVLPNRSGLRASSRHHDLAGDGQPLNVIAEFDSAYDLIRAAEEGSCSTIIGWITAAQLAKHLVIRRLSNPRIERELYLWEPERIPPTAPAMAVKALLKVTVQDMLANDEWPGAVAA